MADNMANNNEFQYTDAEKLAWMEDDLDAAIDEIVRLQARVNALEREHELPDNAFYAQLTFDVAAVVGFIWLVVQFFGGH